MANIKELLLNLLLVIVGLFWVIGVDYYPILKILGCPMFFSAVAVWIGYGKTFKKFECWVHECMDTHYNEE